MSDYQKLLESYKDLTSEEVKKVLIFVETLKTLHTQESSQFPQEKG